MYMTGDCVKFAGKTWTVITTFDASAKIVRDVPGGIHEATVPYAMMHRPAFYGPTGALYAGLIVAAFMAGLFLVCALLRAAEPIRLPAEKHEQLLPYEPYKYTDPVVRDIVDESGVPEAILIRLIASESSWRPHVTSCIRPDGTYDIGLAQIHSGYLDYFATRYMEGALDPLHPVDSLRFAARYLRALYDRLGTWEAAVVAYKTGPARVASAPAWLVALARKVVEG